MKKLGKILGRPKGFVERNWKKNPYLDSKTKWNPSKKSKFPPGIHRMALNPARKNTAVKTQRRIRRKKGVDLTPSIQTICTWRNNKQMKPFKNGYEVVLNKENVRFRFNFSKLYYLKPVMFWSTKIYSDEFWIYICRKINSKNDITWAYTKQQQKELMKNSRIKKSKYPVKVGIFVVFSVKSMEYLILEEDESWNGAHFVEKIVPLVKKFSKNPRKVIDINNIEIIHDKSSSFRYKKSQNALQEAGIKVFEIPTQSPDMNPTENLGNNIMCNVQDKIDTYQENGNAYDLYQSDADTERKAKQKIRQFIQIVCDKMKKCDRSLFKNLIHSMPSRLEDVIKNRGYPSKKY